MGTTVIQDENALHTDTDFVQAESAVEAKENFDPKDQKQTLQSLFSLLREEVEQMDSKILPLCLHQVLSRILGCCTKFYFYLRPLFIRKNMHKCYLYQYSYLDRMLQCITDGQGKYLF